MDLDLEHYVVPAPSTSANSCLVYVTNMTETPRSLTLTVVFYKADGFSSAAITFEYGTGVSGSTITNEGLYQQLIFCKLAF